ncbi:beta propeller repeat protein [Draconibacterium mangrovi]|uniref:sialidase family protein n=1 Tax=Draconibacterium mangrovi TaxID=2697469 RepID=UPI0013D8A93D|nr:sialidase family protein [Draconibacterium mangrovi]
MNKLILSFLSFLLVAFYSNGQHFKTDDIPGVVVNHCFAGAGFYIGSPGICILSDGSYIASHEFFGPGMNETSTVVQIFKSTDRGESWEQVAKIIGQTWSKLFEIEDTLYILGPVASGGDLVIRKSVDGGYTWTTPIDRYSGRIFNGHFHTAPTSVVFYDNRIWKAVEDMDGPVRGWGKHFRAFVVSAPLNCDLLKASNWTKTNPMPFDDAYLNGNFGGWLEGNVVIGPDDKLHNILRVDYRQPDGEKAAIIDVSQDGKTATFNSSSGFINFPGGCKKFNILFDPVTKKYWSISNYVPEQEKGYNPERTRNTLALMFSDDLRHWSVKGIVLYHPDVEKHGFQYADFQFDGKDIIFVSRTAFDDENGGADSQHNANYLTFHRIIDYANYQTPKKWVKLMP